jgi:hypothetical protein
MKERAVSFLSGRLSLEGILTMPKGASPFPAVAICHPHPLYGGSMYNNVVCAVSEALTQASLASLRFNFRGVGGSQGEFGNGIGEGEDVKAAISFMSTMREIDSDRIGLAGYSAGAGFALPTILNDERIKAVAAISLPLSMFDLDPLRSCIKPKFLIIGSKDDLVSNDQFCQFCQALPEPTEYESIKGADHFWRGHESDLAVKAAAFFTRTL